MDSHRCQRWFLVAFVVRVVKMLTHDRSGLFGMARSLSGSSLGIGMILLLLAAVLVCRFIHPATPHAELLGKVSACVVASQRDVTSFSPYCHQFTAPAGPLGLPWDYLVIFWRSPLKPSLLGSY